MSEEASRLSHVMDSHANAEALVGNVIHALENTLNGISFSALGGEDPHTAHDAGKFVIGGHEMALESMMHSAQHASVYDHDMPAHFEMPSLLELHAAHSAHQLV
jgi:hypothetical protein